MKRFYVLLGLAMASLWGVALEAQCVIPGYGYLGNYNGHKYYQSLDYSSWMTAQASAVALGSHLVVVNDAGENAFLEGALAGAFAWIGLTDEGTEGSFTWVNGDPLAYTNWYPFQPDNGGGATDADYVVMTFGGQWEDYPGFASLPHILELAEADCPCAGSADSDCDGANDNCDSCPGGDDSGPCAAQVFPGFSGIPASWICGEDGQKVYMCHGGKTICVNVSAIQAHLNHGDFLGPCVGCVQPRSVEAEETPGLFVQPNPAVDHVTIRFRAMDEPSSLSLLDQVGRRVHQVGVPAFADQVELFLGDYPSGPYFIQVSGRAESMILRIVIAR